MRSAARAAAGTSASRARKASRSSSWNSPVAARRSSKDGCGAKEAGSGEADAIAGALAGALAGACPRRGSSDSTDVVASIRAMAVPMLSPAVPMAVPMLSPALSPAVPLGIEELTTGAAVVVLGCEVPSRDLAADEGRAGCCAPRVDRTAAAESGLAGPS